MTVTHGAINVILASKSQLQKVVLPPLRRASQRKGLPPGPPRPTRPPAGRTPTRPTVRQGAAGLPHKAGKLHAPVHYSNSRQQAEPTHRHVVGMGTAVQQPHLF